MIPSFLHEALQHVAVREAAGGAVSSCSTAEVRSMVAPSLVESAVDDTHVYFDDYEPTTSRARGSCVPR